MKLSVVIPCRNEELFISECIDAIYANSISSEIELSVVVVDGMSDDGTREKVRELQRKYPGLFLVDNTQQITPFAMNIGLQSIQADFYQIVGA